MGASLAIAGCGFQGVFKNPLADPFLLGSAAGAGLGVTLIIVYNINFSFFIINSEVVKESLSQLYLGLHVQLG